MTTPFQILQCGACGRLLIQTETHIVFNGNYFHEKCYQKPNAATTPTDIMLVPEFKFAHFSASKDEFIASYKQLKLVPTLTSNVLFCYTILGNK